MRLFKEKAGVISEVACWVMIDRCWLYTGDTLLQVVWKYVSQYKSDKHLVG